MAARWEHTFEAGGGRGRHGRESGHGRKSSAAIVADDPQAPCLRAERCAGGRRSPETLEWSPAPASQHLCPACQTVLEQALHELPGAYARLGLMSVSPARSGRAVRVPPGSRILANPEADALMREIADVAGGWAARVRAVPQLSLSRHGYPHGSADQVAEDCRVLGVHLQPLLALPVAKMFRTWTYLPGKAAAGGKDPGPLPVVPCRRCSLPVSPSPSGKYWWPAACAHPAAVVAAYTEDADGNPVPSALACSACSKRLPRDWEPAPNCQHEPSRDAAPAARKALAPKGPRTLADVEDEIGHLDVIRAGDGWITAVTLLHGGDGACELTEVLGRARGLLKESAAPPDHLDGVPCRVDVCQAFGLERAPLPAGADTGGEPPFSRCPACRDLMTRPEYQEWATWYAAWAKGEDLACARCEQKRCGECCYPGCSCRAAGHAALRAACGQCARLGRNIAGDGDECAPGRSKRPGAPVFPGAGDLLGPCALVRDALDRRGRRHDWPQAGHDPPVAVPQADLPRRPRRAPAPPVQAGNRPGGRGPGAAERDHRERERPAQGEAEGGAGRKRP